MPTPTERKTVQAHILDYASDIGWTFVPHDEAEQRHGFDSDAPSEDRAKGRSLFFDDMLDAKVWEFNPRYAERAPTAQLHHINIDIYGNKEFVENIQQVQVHQC